MRICHYVEYNKRLELKKPKLNDMIEHTCTLNGQSEGQVILLLSQQFVYRTDKGHEKFCMYKEMWKPLARSAQENEKRT